MIEIIHDRRMSLRDSSIRHFIIHKGTIILLSHFRSFYFKCFKAVSYTHLDVYKRQVEVQRGAQGVGEQPLHGADGALGVVQVQRGRVVFRNDDLAHSRLPLSCCLAPPNRRAEGSFP